MFLSLCGPSKQNTHMPKSQTKQTRETQDNTNNCTKHVKTKESYARHIEAILDLFVCLGWHFNTIPNKLLAQLSGHSGSRYNEKQWKTLTTNKARDTVDNCRVTESKFWQKCQQHQNAESTAAALTCIACQQHRPASLTTCYEYHCLHRHKKYFTESTTSGWIWQTWDIRLTSFEK